MELDPKAILVFKQQNIDFSDIKPKEINYINQAVIVIEDLNQRYNEKLAELHAIKININTVAEKLNISTKTVGRHDFLKKYINGSKNDIKDFELTITRLREKINHLENEIEFLVHNYYETKKEEKIIQKYIEENEKLKNEINELRKVIKNK